MLWSAEGPPTAEHSLQRAPSLFKNTEGNQPPDVKGWDRNIQGEAENPGVGRGKKEQEYFIYLEPKRGEEENTAHLFKMSTHLVSLNICWSITSGLVIASEVA